MVDCDVFKDNVTTVVVFMQNVRHIDAVSPRVPDLQVFKTRLSGGSNKQSKRIAVSVNVAPVDFFVVSI